MSDPRKASEIVSQLFHMVGKFEVELKEKDGIIEQLSSAMKLTLTDLKRVEEERDRLKQEIVMRDATIHKQGEIIQSLNNSMLNLELANNNLKHKLDQAGPGAGSPHSGPPAGSRAVQQTSPPPSSNEPLKTGSSPASSGSVQDHLNVDNPKMRVAWIGKLVREQVKDGVRIMHDDIVEILEKLSVKVGESKREITTELIAGLSALKRDLQQPKQGSGGIDASSIPGKMVRHSAGDHSEFARADRHRSDLQLLNLLWREKGSYIKSSSMTHGKKDAVNKIIEEFIDYLEGQYYV